MTAGGGNVSLGDVGLTTRLGAVTIVSANNTTLGNIFVSSFNQQSGTGQFSQVGTANANGPAGVTVKGNNLFRQGALSITNGGSLTLLNTGTITGAGLNTSSIDGQYIQLPGSVGPINFGGTITARGGFVILTPMILIANPTLDASGGSGGISISNTIDGAHALNLLGGGGNVTITGAIGSSTALSGLNISGNQISLANIGSSTTGVSGATSITAAGALTFTGTTYNGSTQTYNAPSQFSMNGGAMTISSNGAALTFQNGQILLGSSSNLTMTTGGGALVAQSIRAGASTARSLTLSSGSANLSVGQIGQAGDGEFASASLTGAVITLGGDLIAASITLSPSQQLNVGGNIASTNTALSFPTPVVLNTNSTISTGTGANITFSSNLDGASADTQNVTLRAGTGDITFSGAIGSSFTTRPNLVTIATARNVAIGAMSVDGFIQAAGTGTTTLSGAVSIVNNIGFQFTGASLNVMNSASMQTTSGSSITVKNSGTFTFAGSANPDGSFIQSGTGSTTFSGSVTPNQGGVSFAGPVVLTGTPSMNSSTNNQALLFSNTLDGPGSLTLTAGTGAISLLGNAGSTTPLGATTVVSAGNITIQDLACASLNANSSGTMSLAGNLSSSAPAGITLVGVNFIRSGALITTGGGNFTVTNSGTVTGTSINTTSIDGAYTQNGTGPVFFAGIITTTSQTISFSSPITLLAGGGFDTGSGSGDIILAGTVDGTSALSFNAGAGSVTLNSALGSSTSLGAITIATAANVTAQAITATSITQSSGSGTSTFNGAITTSGSAGINLTGTNIVRGAAWTANGAGGITIANSGSFTSTAPGVIQSVGAFQQTNASGPVSISGSILANNAAISFAGPITLAGAATFNSGNGAGNISLSNSVNGAQTLTLSAGTGSITTSSAIGALTRLTSFTISQTASATLGAINAGAFVQLGGTGTTTLSGAVNTNTLSGVSLVGNNFTFNAAVNTTASGPVTVSNSGLFTLAATCTSSGAFTQNGSGASTLSSAINGSSSISFASAITVAGSASLSTTANPITLNSTLDGPGSITLNAGTGSISVVGAAGSLTRLGTVTFSRAANISTLGIQAASVSQTAGTGTTTIFGDLNTTSLSGINFTGTNFTITGSLLSTNGGICTIKHTGLLSLTAGSSTLLSGAFTENGTGGTVNLAGTIHANDANISFANPITLMGATTLNSDGGGDIVISSAIDGPYDLVYDAGTGNITLAADIGDVTPVSSLTISSANNVSTQAITAGFIVQTEGSGTSTFNGALKTTLSNGINLTGVAFSFEAPVDTTSGSGALVINNSGALLMTAAVTNNIGGSFSQTGAGAASLNTIIHANGSQLLFTGPIVLAGPSSLDMDGLGGTLTLSNTVNGPYDLTLESAGNIALSSALGQTIPLAAFQVAGCVNVTSSSISASSIGVSSVTGLATFNGALTTTGASGVSLSGASFTLGGNVTTTNSGPFTLANTSLATIGPSLTLSLSGAFAQTGAGTTDMGGALTTSGSSISFTGPITLIGDLALTSNNGTITLGNSLNGAYSATITAGSGNVTASTNISTTIPLQNFTIVSAHNISLNGVASSMSPMNGALSLTASNTISLANTSYAANSQVYSSTGLMTFPNPGLVTLYTSGGSVNFASATVQLDSGSDLLVETHNGAFSFHTILGTTFENLTIETGSGLSSMGSLTNAGTINTVTVTAGSILLNGPMNLVNTNFTSQTAISNAAAPVNIASTNTATLDALGGNVGSLSSPILVNTSQEIFAGACSSCLAAFDGSSADDTVHPIPSNPPCNIYFNGVQIKSCTPPTPTPTPSSSGASGSSLPSAFKGSRYFAIVGVYDSYFTLADDYFFFTYFLDDRYWRKSIPIFIQTPSKKEPTSEPKGFKQSIRNFFRR
jgi:hypothetical protein